MISGRCAACKYLRRRCPSDCIFSPYFPSNNPQRFACVHRIYGASNVGKMLQQVPGQLRAQAADSMHFEAQCRMEDPVYGCVKIINELHRQIHNAETELAKTRAQIAFMISSTNITQQTHHDQLHDDVKFNFNLDNYFLQEQSTNIIDQSSHCPSTQPAPWFVYD
ncbi:Lateral organ boundaries domain containing protein [Trema orientale]|uniref:Lateral organ boundaries domain containing protein n=1 Tax=Trema orientale TaxID=63057 RepID=A0A2P5C9S6_TREOI|nr:Lateral organ boundaries domain containing protein [Trema orientale]